MTHTAVLLTHHNRLGNVSTQERQEYGGRYTVYSSRHAECRQRIGKDDDSQGRHTVVVGDDEQVAYFRTLKSTVPTLIDNVTKILY